MRLPQRKKMIDHYKTNDWIGKDVDGMLKQDWGSGNSLFNLFDEYKLSAYKPLVELSSNFEEGNAIKEPIEAFFFFLKSLRSKGKFKSKLKRMLRE